MRINGSLTLDAVTSGSTATEIVVWNSTGTILERRSTLPQASIVNLTTDLANKQPLSTTLTNWAAYNSNGIVVQTAANTWAARTITAPAAGITVTNGNGIAGNPTLVLANDLAALEGLGSTGLAVRTATDTWAQRTITGTAGFIVVTNGNGVAGNPTIDLDPTFEANAMLWRTGSSGTGSIRTQSGFNDSTGVETFVTGGSVISMNVITSGGYSSIIGGQGNTISTTSTNQGIFAGSGNSISSGSGQSNVIIGGASNQIQGGANSAIIGGTSNILNGSRSGIISGTSNSVTADTCVVVGGTNNTGNAGNGIILSGNGNSVTGSQAAVQGFSSSASGNSAFATGVSTQANGYASFSMGRLSQAASSNSFVYGDSGISTHFGERASSIGNLSGFNAQEGTILVQGVSTTATAFDLLTGDGLAGINIPAGETWVIDVSAQATITSATNRGNSRVFSAGRFQIKNNAGAMSAISITALSPSAGETGATTFTLSSNTFTGTRLRLLAAGAASTTVSWIARINYHKIKFV